jgi:nucleoside-diphosphate-sugar epimerase
MRYFVTGATGFIGGYVTSQLLAGGHEVAALVRSREQAQALAPYGVRPCIGDVLAKDSMRRAMARSDGVFHLAAETRRGTRHRRYQRAVNVEGTRNVLELMRDLQIPRGVFTSGLMVNGDTGTRTVGEGYVFSGRFHSNYDRSKWQAHHEVALPMIRRGLPLTIVMPGVVYGPRDMGSFGGTLARYVLGRVPAVPTRTTFCWGHVMDVAQGHILAMERGRSGATYMICGPPQRLRAVLNMAGVLVGKRRGPLPAPWWLLRPAAAVMRGTGYLIPPVRGAGERLGVLAGHTYLGDDTRARREIGFSPRPLEEGLPDTVRALLQDTFEV